jgi:hypothetical protein
MNSNHTKILNALDHVIPRGPTEIAQIAGLTPKYVDAVISRVSGVKKIGRGRYIKSPDIETGMELATTGGGRLVPPPCPEDLSDMAASYYNIHVGHFCESGMLRESTWALFVQMAEAWGDWQEWLSLVAKAREKAPNRKGLVVIEDGEIRLSVLQKEKQRAEQHYSKLHRDFLNLALKLANKTKQGMRKGWD